MFFFQSGWMQEQHRRWMQFWKPYPTEVWIIWSPCVDYQSAHISVPWSCTGLWKMFPEFDRQWM